MNMNNHNNNKVRPGISTASLPDIIFILLFFFMVVTVIQPNQLLVQNHLPSATELTKLEHRSLIQHIYVGKPIDKKNGTAPRIQLNDSFASLAEVTQLAASSMENEPASIFDLKVDTNTKMGIVSDVKWHLRLGNGLKINYASFKADI